VREVEAGTVNVNAKAVGPGSKRWSTQGRPHRALGRCHRTTLRGRSSPRSIWDTGDPSPRQPGTEPPWSIRPTSPARRLCSRRCVGRTGVTAVRPGHGIRRHPGSTGSFERRLQRYTFHMSFGHRSRSLPVARPPGGPHRQAAAADPQPGRRHPERFLQEIQSQMDTSSDTDGYLVAYPNGTRISVVLTRTPSPASPVRVGRRALLRDCRSPST